MKNKDKIQIISVAINSILFLAMKDIAGMDGLIILLLAEILMIITLVLII